MDLVEKILILHQTLTVAQLPHAFGGALALAWCTERARGTIDIDVNIFIPAKDFEIALTALPQDIKISKQDRAALKGDGQVRLWWEKTPVDIFLNNTLFHESIAKRIRWEKFSGKTVPFLSCQDLAVFKAFFNRTKDWADLEEMHNAGTLDVPKVRVVLIDHLGAEDERIARLNKFI